MADIREKLTLETVGFIQAHIGLSQFVQLQVHALIDRPQLRLALLEAIDKKQLPRQEISSYTIRQILTLNDKAVSARVEEVWGPYRPASSAFKRNN